MTDRHSENAEEAEGASTFDRLVVPTRGQIETLEAVNLLATHPVVWVRLAAVRKPGTREWQQVALELTSGGPPPSWQDRTSIYPSAIFVAKQCRGTVIAKRLKRGKVWLCRRCLNLAALSPTKVPVQRRPSEGIGAGSGGAFESLPWPSVVMEVSSQSAAQQLPQEPLIAPGEPSFFRYDDAASDFFGRPGGKALRGIVYRHQEQRARITRVVFGLERVQVWVEGEDLVGLSVEVAGNTPGQIQAISSENQGPLSFDFPDGLPERPWVLLRTDYEWLDRRFLHWPYSIGDQPDVEEEEVEPDPTSMIDFFLQRREGPQVEFKRGLPEDTDELIKRVMKSVAAFANGEGGTILFGITKEYEVIGVDRLRLDDDKDRLSDLIDSWVSPRPGWDFYIYPVEQQPGRVVLALNIKPGEEPPYSIGTKNVPTQYYVRHAARSVPARPEELRNIARERPPVAPPAGGGFERTYLKSN